MSNFLFRRQFRILVHRVHSKLGFIVAIITLLSIAVVAYAGYMSTQRLSVNPASYASLLDLIAEIESNGNYNAYFGNARNSEIDFTNMSIANVMKWQKDYVAQGSPSSAVGRYQILSGTLEGLLEQTGISTSQKFDKQTQDIMAIALLERRGSVDYVNNDLTREQFAANLAMEWAALPKVIGENPERSYYAGDGLNKSRIAPEKVLQAIRPIEAAN